ncbi:MAG: hypothetical protein ACKO0V_13605 [bacterium]
MGELGRKLRRKLAGNSSKLSTILPKRVPGEPLPGGIKDLRSLIEEGYDPIHAVYAFMQQVSSHFAECFSHFPELRAFSQVVTAAEDTYMPVGPPISPLTRSFFWTWAFYDLPIGKSGESIGSCQIELNDLIGFGPADLEVIKHLTSSRMGIYEHIGFDGPHVCLRELVTEKQFFCHVASGYRGKTGELWYVRLLPPLLPELASYHVAFTTPYILTDSTKQDWLQFLKRHIPTIQADRDHHRLRHLLKYGADKNFWNEFVLKAYHHHTSNAIFLAGLPDLKSTLPHN